MKETKVGKLFDKFLSFIIKTPHIDEAKPVYDAIENGNREERSFSFTLLGAIDAKTSALLTHISLIVAALSIFFSSVENSVYKLVILSEICIYLLAAMLCLRCIRFKWPDITSQTSISDQDIIEVFIRKRMYDIASDITIFVTRCLILTFVTHIIIAVNS